MPASERATSPPLFGPEVGNWKLPKSEMSLRVPSFSGALLLSMISFLQVTFFIDCKIKKIFYSFNQHSSIFSVD